MSALEEESPEWQPGDELYPRSTHPYSQFINEYRARLVGRRQETA